MLMRQMRQNTKIIMLVTAATFVLLMVFEWGMDISGRSAGAGTLGRVGRTEVSIQEFQSAYRALYDQIQAGQELPISTAQNRVIEDMAWDDLVDQILVRNEVARRGIRVSDEEIQMALLYYPHPQFQAEPSFRAPDGSFDMARYHQFLSQAGQDPNFLAQIEAYYRDLIPRQKLLRQLTLGVYVSDQELWNRWQQANETVEARFIAVSPADQITDAEVSVTRAEVESYYRENRESFAIPARAEVRYIYIDKTPTPADSVAALELAQNIRQEILDGADFAEVAARESGDASSAGNGGLMGTVARGALIAPLDSAAFSLPVGQPSQPIQTPFGYHILKVDSRTGDEAEVRHILSLIRRTPDSEVDLLSRADSLERIGTRRTLQEAADQLGLTVTTGEVSEDYALLPGVGMATDAQDWIFVDRGRDGDVSPLFENEIAFYLVEVVRQSPAGYRTLEEATQEIEDTLRAERKLAALLERSRSWVADLRSGSVSLDDLAERIGVPVRESGAFTRTSIVEGLGQSTAAIGAAFGVAEGGVAGPSVALDQVVILQVDRKTPADRAAWEAQKESQRAAVTAQIQEARLARWIEGVRANTRIVDGRAEYFEAAEAQQSRGMGGLF